MTPHDFHAKWRVAALKESSAAQSHFNELCALLEIVDPTTADPKGDWFAFEKGATTTSGGNGWADVWRKGCFAWEYKGPHGNLTRAREQLLKYAAALDNPPLLIVSDMSRIEVHTNWTNTVTKTYVFELDDLLDGAKRDLLKAAFTDPERLKPTTTRQAVTEDAARNFATLAERLRARGHAPDQVAEFLNRLIFCFFAEDIGLLPNKMFLRLLEGCRLKPFRFKGDAEALFAAMKEPGGRLGIEDVPYFNGGLFDRTDAFDLERDDIHDLIAAAKLDWSEIDPSIMGTLFERGLDPSKRSQLGAHYTDRDKIMLIIDPVVRRPLEAEWAAAHLIIQDHVERATKADAAIRAEQDQAARLLRSADADAKATEPARRKRVADLKRQAEAAWEAARLERSRFLERLQAFRVLDPACGSGNFSLSGPGHPQGP